MLFITGASGFIGKYLVRRLAKTKEKIVCLVLPKEQGSEVDKFLKKYCKVEYGDIINKGDIEKVFKKYRIDKVIHLAAVIKTPNKKVQHKVNTLGTKYLVEASEKNKVKKFVFLSTDFVLYPYRNIYRDTKLEAEKILVKSDLNYTIFRPTPVYGVGDDKNFTTIFDLVKKFPVLPAVKCIMQPVYVEDVVTAIVECLKRSITNKKVYNLPGGDIVTFGQIFKIISKEFGLKRIVITVPNILSRTGIYTYEAISSKPIVRKFQVLKWLLNKPLSLEKQRKDFNYNPKKFRQGLVETMRAENITK